MSDFRIVYPNSANNGVILVSPAPGFTVERILKDIPQGSPYIVVSPSDLPDDDFFEAWEVDFTGAQVRE